MNLLKVQTQMHKTSFLLFIICLLVCTNSYSCTGGGYNYKELGENSELDFPTFNDYLLDQLGERKIIQPQENAIEIDLLQKNVESSGHVRIIVKLNNNNNMTPKVIKLYAVDNIRFTFDQVNETTSYFD